MIPFNKPFTTGKESLYINEALQSRKFSGDGMFTQKCHRLFEQRYGLRKVLLTTSCTDALEMAAILANIQPGDEVIAPSYTFVSTVNAFVLRGAKIVFADSGLDNPNMDIPSLESLITTKTKAIVVVHYAGVACDMDSLLEISRKYNLLLIEDAAQAIDSYYNNKPLGSIGHLATFSFHETKNIQCGEGGMLVVNDDKFVERAEIIRDKGTNRSKFLTGEVDKYEWVDVGSSFLPSDILAAFLFAQLENIDTIQNRRKEIWANYYTQLKPQEEKGQIVLPVIPSYATNNANMFYLLCTSKEERKELIAYLNLKGITAVFHYSALHKSPFYKTIHGKRSLPNADRYTDTLLRLPMYFELSDAEVNYITEAVSAFYTTSRC